MQLCARSHLHHAERQRKSVRATACASANTHGAHRYKSRGLGSSGPVLHVVGELHSASMDLILRLVGFHTAFLFRHVVNAAVHPLDHLVVPLEVCDPPGPPPRISQAAGSSDREGARATEAGRHLSGTARAGRAGARATEAGSRCAGGGRGVIARWRAPHHNVHRHVNVLHGDHAPASVVCSHRLHHALAVPQSLFIRS